jgi:hypothetical protein
MKIWQVLSCAISVESVSVNRRDECIAIDIAASDSCASLAVQCSLSGDNFMKYNPKPNMCSSLKTMQWVCCSKGNLPRPKSQNDGTCATYRVVYEDGCQKIADNNGLSIRELEAFNAKTWGWAGCDQLQPDQIICISDGDTPMPTQKGVECGPQKIGLNKPAGRYDDFDLAKLNPCPLRACCSGWGFCGTTSEFCTESKSESGAPGSFKRS